MAAPLAVDLREFYLLIPFFFMWFLDLPCHASTSCRSTFPLLPRCCPWSRRRRPAAARGSCLSPLYLVGCFRFEVLSSASAPKLPPQCCDGRRSASDQNASSHDCVLRVDMRQDNAGFSAMFLSRPGPEAAAAQEEESWLRLIRHPPCLGGIFSPQRRRNGMRFRGALAAISFGAASTGDSFASRRTCSN